MTRANTLIPGWEQSSPFPPAPHRDPDHLSKEMLASLGSDVIALGNPSWISARCKELLELGTDEVEVPAIVAKELAEEDREFLVMLALRFIVGAKRRQFVKRIMVETAYDVSVRPTIRRGRSVAQLTNLRKKYADLNDPRLSTTVAFFGGKRLLRMDMTRDDYQAKIEEMTKMRDGLEANIAELEEDLALLRETTYTSIREALAA